jgi:hypothetical protein
MGVQYVVTNGVVALVAATAKTIIEVSTDASTPLIVTGWDISMDGVSASATPAVVEFCTYSASGTGTGYTPKRFTGAAGAADSGWKINDTVEPAGAASLFSLFVSPTSGYSIQYPLGRELYVPVSTFLGLRVTAPAGVNARGNIYFEE